MRFKLNFYRIIKSLHPVFFFCFQQSVSKSGPKTKDRKAGQPTIQPLVQTIAPNRDETKTASRQNVQLRPASAEFRPKSEHFRACDQVRVKPRAFGLSANSAQPGARPEPTAEFSVRSCFSFRKSEVSETQLKLILSGE